jgi:hypothetical protein
MELPYEIAAASHEVQAHYTKMIEDGQTERFAVMCSLQQAPGTKGLDGTFMEGKYNGQWLDKLPPKQARWMLAEAKAAGISTVGKFYCSGLADKRGHCDGEAWVDSTSDILRVAKKRNLDVQGAVTHKGTPTPPKRVPLNPKLVNKMAGELMRKDPHMSRRDAVETVKSRHTPHWAKKSG